jgi:hypothetical protein
MDEWIKKMWYIYMMEFYSVIKDNKSMSSSRKWMELKMTKLSEITQFHKDKCHMFSLTCGIQWEEEDMKVKGGLFGMWKVKERGRNKKGS